QRSTAYSAGNGPVSITTDSAGKFIYTANQSSNDVSGFAILSDGSLTPLSGSPYVAGTSPSWVQVDPTNKFVYVTNLTGSPGISIFAIDTTSAGKLNPAGSATAGTTPASIAFK